MSASTDNLQQHSLPLATYPEVELAAGAFRAMERSRSIVNSELKALTNPTKSYDMTPTNNAVHTVGADDNLILIWSHKPQADLR